MGTHFQSLQPDPLCAPEKRKLIANIIDQTETDKFVKVPENQGPKANNNVFFAGPGSFFPPLPDEYYRRQGGRGAELQIHWKN